MGKELNLHQQENTAGTYDAYMICFNKLLSSYPVETPTVCIRSNRWISWWKSTTPSETYAQVRSRLDFFGVMMLIFVLPSKYGIFAETILEDIFTDPSLVYQPSRIPYPAPSLAVCHYDVTCCWLETFASQKRNASQRTSISPKIFLKKEIHLKDGVNCLQLPFLSELKQKDTPLQVSQLQDPVDLRVQMEPDHTISPAFLP